MNGLLLAALAGVAFVAAYRIYGRWLRRVVLRVSDDEPTPAHELRDGVDFVPARRSILFGHHFASIAGLGPILGPAIAVIWGWVPAVLWIVFGTIFIGGVHDFTTLVLSLRNRGRSIGDIASDVIGPRARVLFLLVIYFLMSLAMGVFVIVIATLFTASGEAGARPPQSHPEAVLPVLILLIVAVGMGWALYRWKLPFALVTVVGVTLSFVGLAWGHRYDVTLFGPTPWIWVLLGYAFLASVLPVWLLLQPRDYLNSFQLYAGMGLMFVGLLLARPDVVAPAFNNQPSDLPGIFPFLFITVACGAVSGFHCLVSSGTTAKQIACSRDAQAIGYGGMMTEGMLAILAVLACTAGIATTEEWHLHYASWAQAGGLGPKIGAFVTGAGRFMSATGIPLAGATAFAAVVVVSFALTTLDSATRLLRYNVEEIGHSLGWAALANRYVASGVAVFSIAGFAFLKVEGKPAGHRPLGALRHDEPAPRGPRPHDRHRLAREAEAPHAPRADSHGIHVRDDAHRDGDQDPPVLGAGGLARARLRTPASCARGLARDRRRRIAVADLAKPNVPWNCGRGVGRTLSSATRQSSGDSAGRRDPRVEAARRARAWRNPRRSRSQSHPGEHVERIVHPDVDARIGHHDRHDENRPPATESQGEERAGGERVRRVPGRKRVSVRADELSRPLDHVERPRPVHDRLDATGRDLIRRDHRQNGEQHSDPGLGGAPREGHHEPEDHRDAPVSEVRDQRHRRVEPASRPLLIEQDEQPRVEGEELVHDAGSVSQYGESHATSPSANTTRTYSQGTGGPDATAANDRVTRRPPP